MNNYKAVPDSKYNAGVIKHVITCLRNETGMTEQGIIFRLLDYGLRNHPEFGPHFDRLEGSYHSAV